MIPVVVIVIVIATFLSWFLVSVIVWNAKNSWMIPLFLPSLHALVSGFVACFPGLVSQPLIEGEAQLDGSSVRLCPSLQELSTAVCNIVVKVLSIAKGMDRWTSALPASVRLALDRHRKELGQEPSWLWERSIEDAHAEFQSGKPGVDDFETQLKKLDRAGVELKKLGEKHDVGALALVNTSLVKQVDPLEKTNAENAKACHIVPVTSLGREKRDPSKSREGHIKKAWMDR
eukprot:GHVT01000696.1.p1 GENE.GHVT01000696.1~~GHVT01000696.1.p1  ORF type:complete len:231 (-),score=23.56 GHVT01000696.1:373-1065(-)